MLSSALAVPCLKPLPGAEGSGTASLLSSLAAFPCCLDTLVTSAAEDVDSSEPNGVGLSWLS